MESNFRKSSREVGIPVCNRRVGFLPLHLVDLASFFSSPSGPHENLAPGSKAACFHPTSWNPAGVAIESPTQIDVRLSPINFGWTGTPDNFPEEVQISLWCELGSSNLCMNWIFADPWGHIFFVACVCVGLDPQSTDWGGAGLGLEALLAAATNILSPRGPGKLRNAVAGGATQARVHSRSV